MEPIVVLSGLGAGLWFLLSDSPKPKKKTKTTGGDRPALPPGDDVDPVSDPTRDFPGPEGPRPRPGPGEEPDPRPTVVNNDVNEDLLEEFEDSPWNVYISADCKEVYEGEFWYEQIFLPAARTLVVGFPQQYHHPYAVMWGLLVGETDAVRSPAAPCLKSWPPFIYADRNGTTEVARQEEEFAYFAWFQDNFPALFGFMYGLEGRLWEEPDLAQVFEAPWDDGGELIPFEPGVS